MDEAGAFAGNPGATTQKPAPGAAAPGRCREPKEDR